MAEENDPKDQEERSWAQRLRKMVGMEVKKDKVESAEKAVEKMRENAGRMPSKKRKK